MGMETGLRCEIKLKERYIPLIEGKDIINWIDLFKVENNPIFIDLTEQLGFEDIPNGSVSYLGDLWSKTSHYFYNNKNQLRDSNIWRFECSSRYSQALDYFCEKIVPIIADEVIILETFYEEWARSQAYSMVDGKIFIDNSKSVTYKSYNDY